MPKTTYVAVMVAIASLAFTTTTYADPNAHVERKVKAYFQDAPVMIKIAKCESRFIQYDPSRPDGVLKNPKSSARGVFQILTGTHQKAAVNLGYNLWSLEGNLAYARHLYRQNGTRDWNPSRHCWGRKV